MKHGLKKHKLYEVYYSMKSRCYNSKKRSYKRYGGRGIIVCEEWKNNFLSFYNWAINNRWERGLQIDRIDNDGNYEPSNCRWVSKLVNSRNTSRVMLTVENAIDIRNIKLLFGKDIIAKEIANAYNVSLGAIYDIIKYKTWAKEI